MQRVLDGARVRPWHKGDLVDGQPPDGGELEQLSGREESAARARVRDAREHHVGSLGRRAVVSQDPGDDALKRVAQAVLLGVRPPGGETFVTGTREDGHKMRAQKVGSHA